MMSAADRDTAVVVEDSRMLVLKNVARRLYHHCCRTH
jgi:hypothetical protein